MSVLNYVCTPDRAVLAVDTLGSALDGSAPREISKAVPLHVLRLVLAGRGLMDVFSWVVRLAIVEGMDFDRLAGSVRGPLPRVVGEALDGLRRKGVSGAPGAVDVVMLGWSRGVGHLCARHLHADDRACHAVSSAGHAFLPGVPGDFDDLLADPFDKDAMHRAMQRQYRWAREAQVAGGFGGRMVHFDIGREAIVVDSTRALDAPLQA